MSNAFETFADQYADYGYPLLFIGVLLENAGIPVPGETAVLVAGFLSSPAGGARFQVEWVILLTVIAAVIGDNVGFWLGQRWARPRLLQGRGFLFLTPKTLELAERYFHRYGSWTVFFARFITGLRVVGALAAGTSGMHWRRFLFANAGGAIAWATTMCLLGYFFGHSWDLLHRWLGRGGLVIAGCVVVLVGLPHMLHQLRKLPSLRLERFTSAQIRDGILAAVLEVICIGILVLTAQGRHETALNRRIDAFIASHESWFFDTVATASGFIGSLPILTLGTLLVLAYLVRKQRGWNERLAVIGALMASEIVGLILAGLLRARSVIPIVVDSWPHGFAGLVPIRSFAVFGMIAYLIHRHSRRVGRFWTGLAVVLIAASGFSVVWRQEQTLTETLLEFAAGGIVLFAGVWWLEGFGPGVIAPAQPETPTESPASQ